MGGCCSVNTRFERFRESLIAKKLTEGDRLAFFEKCKLHQIDRGSSVKLQVSSDIVFFLVLAGEVEVLIQKDKRNTTLATYQPGETIILPPGTPYEKGIVRCGKISLMYVFKSEVTGGELLYMDRPTLDQFLATRPHLKRLRAITHINKDLISMFLKLPGFKSITPEQMYFMFSCIKIVRFNAGQVITLNEADEIHLPSHNDTTLSANTASSRSKKFSPSNAMARRSRSAALLSTHPSSRQLLDELSRPLVHAHTIALLMKGSCVFLPNVTDLMQLIATVVAAHSKNAKEKPSHTVEAIELHGSLKDNQVFPGSVIGYDNFFVENNPLQPESLVALEDGLLGYFSLDSFRVMFASDAKLRRELRCNFNRCIIDNVRSNVSLLGDLDEDTYASWCSKITLRGFKPGDYICKHGQDSRYAYIVVYGLVQEVDGHLHSTEVYSPGSGEASSASSIHTTMTPLHEGAKDSSLPASLPPLQTSAEPSLEAPVRYLGPGSLFGEVPLVTDSPYFSTVQAAAPTVLACISKHMLDLVYNENKAKLAELRIRVAGSAVELEDILQYPEANKLFYKFCEKEMSTENVSFYNAVTRYEEMFDRMTYYILHSVPIGLWNKIVEANESAEENGMTVTGDHGTRGIRLRSEDGSLLLPVTRKETEEGERKEDTKDNPSGTPEANNPSSHWTASDGVGGGREGDNPEALSIPPLSTGMEAALETSTLKLVATKVLSASGDAQDNPQSIVLSLTLNETGLSRGQEVEIGLHCPSGVEGYPPPTTTSTTTTTATSMATSSLAPTSAAMMLMSRSIRGEGLTGPWISLSPQQSSSALLSAGSEANPSHPPADKRSVVHHSFLHASFQVSPRKKSIPHVMRGDLEQEGIFSSGSPGQSQDASQERTLRRNTVDWTEAPFNESGEQPDDEERFLSSSASLTNDKDEEGADEDDPLVNTELEDLPYQPESAKENPIILADFGQSDRTQDLLFRRPHANSMSSQDHSHGTNSCHIRSRGSTITQLEGEPILANVAASTGNGPGSTERDWLLMLQDVQQTLERYFRDLREVAKSIVEKHIFPGAVAEVNLPSRIRDDTLKAYQEISEQSIHRDILQHFLGMIGKYLSADSHRISLSSHHATSAIPFQSIFHRSKAEIFKLMQRDTFMRYKRSSDFTLFLVKMKPYAPERRVKTVDVKFRGGKLRPSTNSSAGGEEGDTERQADKEESLTSSSVQSSSNSLTPWAAPGNRPPTTGSPRRRSYLSAVSEESQFSRELLGSRRSGGTGYMHLYVTSSVNSSTGTISGSRFSTEGHGADEIRRFHSMSTEVVEEAVHPAMLLTEDVFPTNDDVDEHYRVKGGSSSRFSSIRTWISSDRRLQRKAADVVPLS